MIKDRSLHYKSAEEIKAFQEERLRETLSYVAEHSAFYKRMFKEHNIDVSQINTIEDLQKALETGDRTLVGRTFPANGLCLTNVEY